MRLSARHLDAVLYGRDAVFFIGHDFGYSVSDDTVAHPAEEYRSHGRARPSYQAAG